MVCCLCVSDDVDLFVRMRANVLRDGDIEGRVVNDRNFHDVNRRRSRKGRFLSGHLKALRG